MKRIRLLLMFLCCLGLPGRRAPAVTQAVVPPPDVASYTIQVRYDPLTYTLSGQQTATYYNHTAVPIPTLVFHLYLNAFRSADTLWMREAGLGLRGYSYDAAYPGQMRIERITLADGTALTLKALDDDETLVETKLPQAVAPGASVTVQMAFSVQLPKVFARAGWADGGDFVFGGQWFPKFGVWENGAWNAHPFHANSEFYADFGRYEVAITLPEGWKVAATATAPANVTLHADGTATHTFVAEHVIDFAWAASPKFREMIREVNGIAVRVVYDPRRRAMAQRALQATARALPLYGAWYGRYGKGLYPQLTVVVVPSSGGGAGGMEYPTLFTVGVMGGTPLACERLLEVETVHELAHQWFQSVVATNEAEAPWLDEGFTDYSTIRAMNALYDGAVFDCGGWSFSYTALQRMQYTMAPNVPMAGAAWEYNTLEYAAVAYSKPSLALTMLERLVGEAAMQHFLSTYYARYAFTHPHTEDVRAVMNETLGEEVTGWFFDALVYGDGILDAHINAFDEDVTLERQGTACIPTSVKITRERSEDEETIPWPCEQTRLTVAGAPRSVEIDPAYAIVLDRNLVNNGQRRTPDLATWLGLIVRWTRALQDFFWGGAAW